MSRFYKKQLAFKPFFRLIFLFLGLLVLSTRLYASPVNVNIAAAQDVAEALDGVDIYLAELIVMQCEIQTCDSPEDIRHLRGLTSQLYDKIKVDLRFEIMHRGMDLDDDC